jgi:hypothetical protein
MAVLNDIDRFELVGDVVDRVPSLKAWTGYGKQAMRDKLVEHRQYILEHREDMPEAHDKPGLLIPNKLRRPAIRGHDDGFRRAPGLEHDDAEGLIPARHADHVSAFEQLDEFGAVSIAEKPNRIEKPRLHCSALERRPHLAVADENELRIGAIVM